jgi:hypothetical protein
MHRDSLPFLTAALLLLLLILPLPVLLFLLCARPRRPATYIFISRQKPPFPQPLIPNPD